MWLEFALCVSILLLYCVVKLNRFDYWKKKGVPTASGCEWFFGHYRLVMFVKVHINKVFDKIYNEFPNAPLVGYYQMSLPALIVRDPEVIKTVLVSEFSNFSSNGFSIDKSSDIIAAYNPFMLQGEEWKASRSRATPALTLSKLKGYLPSILKVGDVMNSYIRRNSVGGKEVDVKELSTMFTTDVVANAIYGIENNTFEDKGSLFAKLTKELTIETTVANNFKYLLLAVLPFMKHFCPLRFTSKKLENTLVSLTRKIMKDRVANNETRNDLYQVLINFKANDTEGVFTDEYITSLVFTTIVDLYETASNAILHSWLMLAKHPEIQDKLRCEIKDLRSRTTGDYTVEDIENMKYLDMVHCESMRLFSFTLSRECTVDCYLPLPGVENPLKIAKGTPISIPAMSLHRDPKYYPNPDKFDPERFTEEEIAKRPKFTYLPFGDGPKKCLGVRIATLELKVAIIKIVDKFILKQSNKTKYPIELEPGLLPIIRPKDGAWIIFEEIK